MQPLTAGHLVRAVEGYGNTPMPPWDQEHMPILVRVVLALMAVVFFCPVLILRHNLQVLALQVEVEARPPIATHNCLRFLGVGEK